MTRVRHYEATVCLGVDEGSEFDVKASYTVAWGSPETGNFGPPENYDPGSPDEVENVRILEINGLTSGWSQFTGGFLTDEKIAEILADTLLADHAEQMLHEAAEDDDGRREQAAEYRAEAAREALDERL